MRWFLLCGLLLSGCGGAVTAGTWQLTEIMSHRCRSSGLAGLICDEEDALEPSQRVGVIYVDELADGRLHLVDVDGRTTVGRSYTDGARFRWYEKRSREGGACVESSDELLELVRGDEGLEGQRRVVATASDGCGSASVSDDGFVVRGVSLEVQP